MLPIFSIIVPSYNRPNQLLVCLEALARLSYPKDRFEVIVVDDGSEPSLERVVSGFDESLDARCLRQRNSGPAAARNLGARHAKGDILAFTDDDCAPEPGWLNAIAKRVSNGSECLVGGKTVNRLMDNPFSATSQLILDVVYQHYNADPERARFFASNNLAMPTSLFQESGGFDVAFRTSEDREFCDRFLFRGLQLVYEPDAVISHAHDLTFRQFVAQHFNYGRGAHRYHALRALRGSGQFRTELKFHLNLRNWLLLPFVRPGRHTAGLMAGLILTWQAVNAAGFAWQALVSTFTKVNRELPCQSLTR